MSSVRGYCQSIQEGRMTLEKDEAHHLVRVRRLGVGDAVELFDGRGTIAQAVIDSIEGKTVTVRVEDIQKTGPKPGPQIVIAVSIAKGARFDWLLAKLTELGIDRICPVIFERTVKLAANPKALDRWGKIMIESAKQCGCNILPQIDTPAQLDEFLEQITVQHPNATMIYGDIQAQASILNIGMKTDEIIALVGPEGGFTEAEAVKFTRIGAKAIRLTETTLRTETAAVAIASVLSIKKDGAKI